MEELPDRAVDEDRGMGDGEVGSEVVDDGEKSLAGERWGFQMIVV